MITISNGNSKFILGTAAAEVFKRGNLDTYITAGYPTEALKRTVRLLGLGGFRPVGRFLARQEAIPEQAVRAIWSSEVFNQMAGLVRTKPGMSRLAEVLDHRALKTYSRRAARLLQECDSRIYHYRSGYGGDSLAVAKRKGMVTLCDHSIAHPAALDYLIANGGRLPPKGTAGRLSKIWRTVLSDIDAADAIVVNSDFVKKTFVHVGWRPERVFVAYTGVDDEFLDAIPERRYAASTAAPVSIAFAGELSTRKGAEVLLEALQRISDLAWRIDIIGAIHPDISRRYAGLLKSSRFSLAGFIPRTDLARRMSNADVFVFPSLCEGSARVVFMALASGCYVVTTENSGSIVTEGVHGRLVAAGSVDHLEAALRTVISNSGVIEPVGRHNARLIRSSYRQSHYGDALASIYAAILSEPAPLRCAA